VRQLLHLVGQDGDRPALLEWVLVASIVSLVAVVAVIKMSQGISVAYAEIDHVIATIPAGF
jgi:hypothetical protein